VKKGREAWKEARRVKAGLRENWNSPKTEQAQKKREEWRLSTKKETKEKGKRRRGSLQILPESYVGRKGSSFLGSLLEVSAPKSTGGGGKTTGDRKKGFSAIYRDSKESLTKRSEHRDEPVEGNRGERDKGRKRGSVDSGLRRPPVKKLLCFFG